MAKLLFGAETEYAVAGRTPKRELSTSDAATALVELVPRHFKFIRDSGTSGGFFLSNGGRLYVDCGTHPEYSTPECTNPWDVVRHIEAGHRILANLARVARGRGGRGKNILCFRSNIDYSGSDSTWGSHESYLTRHRSASIRDDLIPHLVTRPIYTGAGGFKPLADGLQFILSPRLSHFHCLEGSNTTTERGIWHEKCEPLSDGYDRVHIVCGESLCSQTALLLKSGVTALIVAMADEGLDPGDAVRLGNPVAALQAVIRDVQCSTKLTLKNGEVRTPIEVQRHYLEMAEAHLADSFMPDWAAELCQVWRTVLDRVAAGPEAVANTLDWAIKYKLYANQAQQMGIEWDASSKKRVLARTEPIQRAAAPGAELDPLSIQREFSWSDSRLDDRSAETVEESNHPSQKASSGSGNSRERLLEIDTRFGQLGPEGIFDALDAAGALDHRVIPQEQIDLAVKCPPEGSRAKVRGEVVQRLAGSSQAKCDWNQVIDGSTGKSLDLSDPFSIEETWKPLELDIGFLSGQPMWEFPPNRSRRGFRYNDARALENGPQARRERAYSHFTNGRHMEAEQLLRTCVAEGYELGSNRCHLARVLMLMNREEEARIEVELAWESRTGAASYVAPRILFFRLLFGMLDGSDLTDTIRELKSHLHHGRASSNWTIQPVLEHIGPRLSEDDYELLKSIASALSESGRAPDLDEHERWRKVGIEQTGTSQAAD